MILPPIMAILARLCGASWSPKWFPAQLVWALVIAAATYTSPHVSIMTLAWSYTAMQLGHGRFYGMQGANTADSNPEDIEQYVQKVYKGDITKPIYSWYCMGAKGFLIALPIGVIPAIANAILWPFAYWLGWKINGDSPEWIAGAFLGSLLWASL